LFQSFIPPYFSFFLIQITGLVNEQQRDDLQEGASLSKIINILESKTRRKAALNGIGATKFDEASSDTKELWQRLTSDWYPEIFGGMKNCINKALLSSAKDITEVLDISDEAICLVILDVKILELLHVVKSREKAREKHREALQRKDECDKNNEPLPDGIKKVLEKYGYDKTRKEKIKRGRKKRRKNRETDTASLTPEDLEDYNEDIIPEHLLGGGESMELIKHKHTFEEYLKRVHTMRLEEANLGWYAAAWLDVKKKWDLDHDDIGGDGSESHLSGLSEASPVIRRPAAAQTISSWREKYEMVEI
jgi:hypothetical protein